MFNLTTPRELKNGITFLVHFLVFYKLYCWKHFEIFNKKKTINNNIFTGDKLKLIRIFNSTIVLFVILSQLLLSKLTGQNKMFEGKSDIGKINIHGAIKYCADNKIEITGSGENIWGKEDAFFYSWNKVEGDLSLSMEYQWVGAGKHEHRKAGWMIRAGLEPDDAYVDAVIHGDGLISMQYRIEKGGDTYELK